MGIWVEVSRRQRKIQAWSLEKNSRLEGVVPAKAVAVKRNPQGVSKAQKWQRRWVVALSSRGRTRKGGLVKEIAGRHWREPECSTMNPKEEGDCGQEWQTVSAIVKRSTRIEAELWSWGLQIIQSMSPRAACIVGRSHITEA